MLCHRLAGAKNFKHQHEDRTRPHLGKICAQSSNRCFSVTGYLTSLNTFDETESDDFENVETLWGQHLTPLTGARLQGEKLFSPLTGITSPTHWQHGYPTKIPDRSRVTSSLSPGLPVRATSIPVRNRPRNWQGLQPSQTVAHRPIAFPLPALRS